MGMVDNMITEAAQDPMRAARFAKRKVTNPVTAVKRRLYCQGIRADPLAHVWMNTDQVVDMVVGGETQPGDYHADVFERFQPRDQDWEGRGESVEWGAVKGGDWDQHRVPVEDLLVYQGCREHFLEGVPWRETTLVQAHIDRIEAGYTSMGYNTVDEILDRYARIDDLYQSIVERGYLSQPEIGNRWQPHLEIIVNLDRHGEPVFNGQGRHRLALTKLLDIDQIAVSILVRHADIIYGTTNDEKRAVVEAQI